MSSDDEKFIKDSIDGFAEFLDKPEVAYPELSELLNGLADPEKSKSKEIFVPGTDKIRGVNGEHLTRISAEIAKYLQKLG